MKYILFALGTVVLVGSEISRVYFIMPFPGSQEDEAVQLAYWITENIWLLRLAGLVLIAYPAFKFITTGSQTLRIIVAVVLAFYCFVAYMFNFKFLADKIFLQPEIISFKGTIGNKVNEKQLVLGVTINNQSKAYPIEIIGYHHQVRDTLGGESIMVTYCTVCRTGRVYSPMVAGKLEDFRLVGMDHYNAMFEDNSTKSWWRQVSGEAIVGPLKGKQLPEIPSEQMTLASWINKYPQTLVLQADTTFKDAYAELKDYDEGKMKGRLESKDSLSWMDKSWVVGIQIETQARAYDWIELQQARLIEDELNSVPLLVVAEPDSATFHVYNRIMGGDILSFSILASNSGFTDSKTNSV